MSSPPVRTLDRGLGPWASASIVVGTIIGTGVFIKTARMAQLGGSPLWVLVAWGVAAALSFTGAMTYSELGGMYPSAGGEYVYLRHGYSPFMGYLYAWNRFWIATPASIAAYGVGAATFLAAALPLDRVGGTPVVGIVIVIVFSAVNCLRVRAGGALQTVLTVMKIVMILGIAGGAVLAPHGSWSHLRAEPGHGGFPGWTSFGAMVLAALWAYDGWNNLPMAAGEIRDPQRNLPRATLYGMVAVLATYALLNLGYFHALPFADIVHANSDAFPDAPPVATKAASVFLGGPAQALLAVAMTISAISAMNGSILTGARVPAVAVLVQGGLAVGFALSGSFDALTDSVIFASWLFYGLNAGSVLLLRRRAPDLARPFRVPGFPIVPIVLIVLAILLVIDTIIVQPWLTALGLGATAAGGVVYAVFLRGKWRPG